MRRRELIIALGFAMAWPIAANGQQDARALRSQILLMQAECIADKLAEFVKQVQNQVDWTTQLPSTGGSIEQRQFDALRLLRQAPAITELSLLDAEGKEFYKVSRLALRWLAAALTTPRKRNSPRRWPGRSTTGRSICAASRSLT